MNVLSVSVRSCTACAALVLLFVLAGCERSDPSQAAHDFVHHLGAGEVTEAAGMLRTAEAGAGEMNAESTLQRQSQQMQQRGGVAGIEIVEQVMDDEGAAVEMLIDFEDGESQTRTLRLTESEVGWLVEASSL